MFAQTAASSKNTQTSEAGYILSGAELEAYIKLSTANRVAIKKKLAAYSHGAKLLLKLKLI
jgi:hypothetical protein